MTDQRLLLRVCLCPLSRSYRVSLCTLSRSSAMNLIKHSVVSAGGTATAPPPQQRDNPHSPLANARWKQLKQMKTVRCLTSTQEAALQAGASCPPVPSFLMTDYRTAPFRSSGMSRGFRDVSFPDKRVS